MVEALQHGVRSSTATAGSARLRTPASSVVVGDAARGVEGRAMLHELGVRFVVSPMKWDTGTRAHRSWNGRCSRIAPSTRCGGPRKARPRWWTRRWRCRRPPARCHSRRTRKRRSRCDGSARSRPVRSRCGPPPTPDDRPAVGGGRRRLEAVRQHRRLGLALLRGSRRLHDARRQRPLAAAAREADRRGLARADPGLCLRRRPPPGEGGADCPARRCHRMPRARRWRTARATRSPPCSTCEPCRSAKATNWSFPSTTPAGT